MTQDEIQAVARAIEDQLTAEEGWMVGTPAIKRMCEDFAQAAIAALDAAREKEDLVAEIERLREALGEICRDSNPDWTEKRVYPTDVLDDIHTIAVRAYYKVSL